MKKKLEVIKNKIIHGKFLLVVFLVFLFSLSGNAQPASAVIPVNVVLNVYQTLIDSVTAVAKQSAALMLNQAMTKAVGGSSPQYITDWTDFLEKNPKKEADKFLNDYLAMAAGGRGSLSSYIPVAKGTSFNLGLNDPDFEGVGPDSFKKGLAKNNPEMVRFIESAEAAASNSAGNNGTNYIASLIENARANTINKAFPVPTYVGDPSKMFENGDLSNLTTYFSGVNNPWAFQANAEEMYAEKLASEKAKASDKAQSSLGFTNSSNKVGTPGVVIANTLSDIKSLGTSILADADNLPQVLVASVANFAISAVSGSLSSETSTSSSSGAGMTFQNNLQAKINKNVKTAKKQLNESDDFNLQDIWH
jgi:hypothetical protein